MNGFVEENSVRSGRLWSSTVRGGCLRFWKPRGISRQSGVRILIGRVFLGTFDCPFRAMDKLLDQLDGRPSTIIVDIHAEATSEKAALAWYLDGRVSAVLGTHTHVATADPRVLPKGTAFVSDVGMVGPVNSIIGVEPKEVLERFLTQMPRRFKVARGGPTIFNFLLVLLIGVVSGTDSSIAIASMFLVSWEKRELWWALRPFRRRQAARVT